MTSNKRHVVPCARFRAKMTDMRVTAPITLEEAERLDLPPDRRWELHEGEIVEMTYPSFVHKLIQDRLAELLKPIFRDRADVMTEMPFHILNRKDDYRSADVGVLSLERRPHPPEERIANGAPELVIEVLSPSNRVKDIKKLKRVCTDNLGELFWVVDDDDLSVSVTELVKPEIERVYKLGSNVPIHLLGIETSLPVSEIFRDIVDH